LAIKAIIVDIFDIGVQPNKCFLCSVRPGRCHNGQNLCCSIPFEQDQLYEDRPLGTGVTRGRKTTNNINDAIGLRSKRHERAFKNYKPQKLNQKAENSTQ
jgi:hypothetical protein